MIQHYRLGTGNIHLTHFIRGIGSLATRKLSTTGIAGIHKTEKERKPSDNYLELLVVADCSRHVSVSRSYLNGLLIKIVSCIEHTYTHSQNENSAV